MNTTNHFLKSKKLPTKRKNKWIAIGSIFGILGIAIGIIADSLDIKEKLFSSSEPYNSEHIPVSQIDTSKPIYYNDYKQLEQDKIFTLNPSKKIMFSSTGNVFILQYILWTGWDTVVASSLSSISEILLLKHENKLVLKYFDEEPNDEVTHCQELRRTEFFQFIRNLKTYGYKLKFNYKPISNLSITAYSMLLLSAILFLAASEKSTATNWLSAWLMLFSFIILFFLARC